MSEDELDKVIWQESHAADERERHIDRLKELTGLDYGDFERELEKRDQYAAMLWSSRDTAREECNATLERAEAAEKKLAEYEGMSFEEGVMAAERRAEKLVEASAFDLQGLVNEVEVLQQREANLSTFLKPSSVAQFFHETYERQAPRHGYQTRKDSAVPWDDVPPGNKALMLDVAERFVLMCALEATTPIPTEEVSP